MTYRSAVLAVRDMKKAREIYEGLFGLTVSEDYGENVAFSCGLALQAGFSEILDLPEPQCGHEGFELYFEEDDLDKFSEQLSKYDVALIHAVKEQPWAQRCLRFYDCDMHIIEVGESMATTVKRLLGQGMSDEEVMKKTQQTEAFVLECKEATDVRR